MNIKYIFTIVFCIIVKSSFTQIRESFTLNFAFDKYVITKENAEKLDSVVNAIKHRPVFQIQINGHSDSRGSNKYNDVLSLKRVHAILDYLRSNNIKDSISIVETGFGKRKLLNTEDTDELRSLNRRVEIIIDYTKESDHNGPKKNQENRSLSSFLSDTLTKAGSIFKLQNLQFEGGTTQFLSTSIPVLKELRKALLNIPKLKISIEGHICCGQELGPGEMLFDQEYKYKSRFYKLS